MAIFQKSVVEKFLSNLDDSVVDSAYERFKEVYSLDHINNIKTLKEEQYQEGFIRDIFVTVLGYTIPPSSNYNIELEKKNETDSKKADGAILKDGKVIGVIELKGNNTKTLDSVKDQAFGYKNNHKGCKYVISSNFRKLRFYIDDATEYEEFDLYSLDRKEFARLFLFLSKEELLDKNTSDKLKEETKFHEEDITKKLYKDYSSFKHKFFNNIVKNNPQYDKLLLFKKSQKFLDRILFILFSEDKKLIPENAISKIVESWEDADDLHYKPLYELFKILFTHLNKGHKYKSGYEIPAYNGGLFIADEVLDNISVDDEVLKDDLLILSKYDFNTEVDVNILGHIFEHSLTELEEIEAEIKGEVADNQKSKRKKDGVFYTPKYITKYIVENTIGKLCNQKKEELNIEDFDVSEYQKRNGKVNSKGEALFNVLEDYKKWLFELRIVDPACGSGAFLNQALSFLIKEHKFIDDLIAELTNTPLRLFDTDKAILEKNIFGVDINDESIEIAKLSLWLRTAQKGRKLSNLSNNIKCGNSLINDVEVAGDKAFDWQKEFPEVFANGGFDVVIGNPPYLRIQGLKDAYPIMVDYYDNNYDSATGNYDIYVLFLEKCQKLITNKGLVSFILPHKFLISEFGEGIRKVFKEKRNIIDITHFQEHLVFNDATTYTCIITYTNIAKSNFKFRYVHPNNLFEIGNFFNIDFKDLNYEKWNINNPQISQIIGKLNNQPNKIGEYIKVFSGIQTSGDKIYIIEGKEDGNYISGYSKSLDRSISIEKGLMKNVVKGDNIKRYSSLDSSLFVLFPYDLIDNKAVPILENDLKKRFPKGYDYLLEHEQELRGREKGKMDKEGWFLYVYPKNLVTSNLPKIVSPDITLGLQLTKDEKGICVKNGAYGISINKEYNISEMLLMAVLNSNLLWFFLKNTGNVLRGGYFRFNTKYINPFPVFPLENQKDIFKEKVLLIIEKNEKTHKLVKRFIKRINSSFEINKFSNKILSFYEHDFNTLLLELKKNKIKLSLSQQDEWEDYFDEYTKQIHVLQNEINTIDSQINHMVYELYALTEEEIKIVEEG
jgi:hypothetical protein